MELNLQKIIDSNVRGRKGYEEALSQGLNYLQYIHGYNFNSFRTEARRFTKMLDSRNGGPIRRPQR